MMEGHCLGEKHYDWYRITILMICYGFGEYGHYLLGVISRPLTQDLEFGTKSCVSLNLDVEQKAPEKCLDFTNETICNNITLNGTNYCQYNYSGQGIEYQVLAGPIFILVFTIMGLVNGFLGDRYSRVRILSFNVFLYSLMIFGAGFANSYWLFALFRFGLGAGESACTPLTASIVADMFGKKMRAFAMGFFNWGIYFGYGMAFALGNYVTEADINGLGWRWCYWIMGAPAILFAFILFFSVKEPEKKQTQILEGSDYEPVELLPLKSRVGSTLKMFFTSPVMIFLLLGASIRHSASFCWSYNSQIYFQQYYPGADIGLWMALDSIVGGTFGIIIGGILSDRLAAKFGIKTRLWVLVGSQLIAGALACGTLSTAPPYAFVYLLFTYFFAEMWFGVLFTVLVEFFPAAMRTTAIAIFIFIINNIGGNAPLIVPPIREALDLQKSLYITYAGFYGLSSFFFLLAQIAFIRSKPNMDDPGQQQAIRGIEIKTLKKM